MPIGPGSRLGPYEVIALIGQGGMGKVWRAHHTALKRDDALKVLPDAFAADPERLARFRREAQVLASLNHPNIAHVYGLEQADGVQALVMELVEGPTLADRIAQGPIPVDETLPIAKQIAEALEAAHEQSIVHRDLKPANIKLRPDGVVKVLDFGLAKAFEPTAARTIDATASPTITSPAMMTGVGVLLGTAAYMSPEQARGKPVDKRSDIWAFGCVLYEMLTGKRAFVGDDVSDTLAAVLRAEPDWSRLPANTRGAVHRLLRRCLQKDARERLHDISDARIEIQEAQATTNPEVNTVASPAPVRRRERVVWTLLALSTLGLMALAVPATLWVRRAVPEPVITRLDVVTPRTTDAFSFALSPDGRQLAFVANGEMGSQIWLRPLDHVNAQLLTGTENASYPFWAPDGRAIGFFADGKLKRIDLTGGTPQVLADATQPRGGAWSRDGVIIFAPTGGLGLMRVTATGGTPVPMTTLATGQSHRWPQFLADGRRFLFLVGGGQATQTRGVYVSSLDGGEPTRVVASETNAYVASGYLLRVSQGVLVAQAFDETRAMVDGEPIPVAQAVGANDGALHSGFSVSAAGVLAHRAGGAVQRVLVWVDRAGKMLGSMTAPDENAPANPELARDGQRVVMNRTIQVNQDLWVTELNRNVMSRFTLHWANDTRAVWSPDGNQLVFTSNRNSGQDLFVKPTSGAAEEQPLLVTPQLKAPMDWSPDGRVLLYANQDPGAASDLWALPLTGDRKPFPVVQTSFDEIQGQFSPDGRWLAYASNESGRYEIYVQPFPERGAKRQISTAGGIQPRWRADGKELFYVTPGNQLMAVPISQATDAYAIAVSAPVTLFQTRLVASAPTVAAGGYLSRAQYAVARDGRFLMNVLRDDTATPPITIVQNWTAGLKQ